MRCNGSDKEQQKNNRELLVERMSPIIKDIFNLWDEIETTFAYVSGQAGRRYGVRKYSKFDNNNVV